MVMFREYPKIRNYISRENGKAIKYSIEYSYWWEDTSTAPDQIATRVASKGPRFSAFQNRDTYRDMDIVAPITHEMSQRLDISAKMESAWRQEIEKKSILDKKQISEPDVANLIARIQNAKDVVIYGIGGDFAFKIYSKVQISYVDGERIDLASGNVSRDSMHVLTIPTDQIPVVSDALNQLRIKAMLSHRQR